MVVEREGRAHLFRHHQSASSFQIYAAWILPVQEAYPARAYPTERDFIVEPMLILIELSRTRKPRVTLQQPIV